VINDKQTARLTYLMDQYKLYHGHINTMFNYFLLLSGLILNAFIQSIQKQADINPIVSICIALFGAFTSFIALLIHIRSRDMLDTIEDGLKREELVIFQTGSGVLNKYPTRGFLFRHKYQFRITYWSFIIAFLAMAAYSMYLLYRSSYITDNCSHYCLLQMV
jgi:hypothetical protein